MRVPHTIKLTGRTRDGMEIVGTVTFSDEDRDNGAYKSLTWASMLAQVATNIAEQNPDIGPLEIGNLTFNYEYE